MSPLPLPLLPSSFFFFFFFHHSGTLPPRPRPQLQARHTIIVGDSPASRLPTLGTLSSGCLVEEFTPQQDKPINHSLIGLEREVLKWLLKKPRSEDAPGSILRGPSRVSLETTSAPLGPAL